MKIKYKKSTYFSLVEIIVSMALFLILMGAVTRFFYAANTLWTDYGRKNALYSDARIAMNLLATDLQNSFYEADRVPFWSDSYDTAAGAAVTMSYNKLCFFTELSEGLNSNCKSRITEVQYKWFEQDASGNYVGELKRYAAGDYLSSGGANGAWSFPPTTPITSNDFYTGASDAVEYPLYTIIIPCVVAFQWTCYDKDGNQIVTETAGGTLDYPYSVRIDLELMDPVDYKKYAKILSDGDTGIANSYKNKRKRVFSREVILGDRGQ